MGLMVAHKIGVVTVKLMSKDLKVPQAGFKGSMGRTDPKRRAREEPE